MTPKTKATELVNTYYDELSKRNGIYVGITGQSKQCAIIAVDEIIKVCPYYDEEKARTDAESVSELRAPSTDFVSFWEKVK